MILQTVNINTTGINLCTLRKHIILYLLECPNWSLSISNFAYKANIFAFSCDVTSSLQATWEGRTSFSFQLLGHTPSLRKLRPETQGSIQEAGSVAEAMEKYCLLAWSTGFNFFYNSGPSAQGKHLLQQAKSSKISHLLRKYPTDRPTGQPSVVNWYSFFTNKFILCQADKKNNQHSRLSCMTVGDLLFFNQLEKWFKSFSYLLFIS